MEIYYNQKLTKLFFKDSIVIAARNLEKSVSNRHRSELVKFLTKLTVSPKEALFQTVINSTKTIGIINDKTAFPVTEMLIAPIIGGTNATRIHESEIPRAFCSSTAYVSIEM